MGGAWGGLVGDGLLIDWSNVGIGNKKILRMSTMECLFVRRWEFGLVV